MIRANFFWHGPRLRLYERTCLASFLKPGFSVRLHSFNRNLAVPEGVELVDARALAREEEVFGYTQGGIKGSIAAFSDIFRYRLFREETGWWFDTDVFCLKSAADFAELERRSKGLLVGEEQPGLINGAVNFVSEIAIARELEERATAKGSTFAWGAIGPRLVTEFVAAHPDRATVLPSQAFYPVHHSEAEMYFQPERLDACRARTAASVCVHLWNEIIGRWGIPQDIMPCEGSYLHALFAQTGVRVDPAAALPFKSFAALRGRGEMGRLEKWALTGAARMRRLQVLVWRRPPR